MNACRDHGLTFSTLSELEDHWITYHHRKPGAPSTHDARQLLQIWEFLERHYPEELSRHPQRETTADIVIRLLSTGVR